MRQGPARPVLTLLTVLAIAACSGGDAGAPSTTSPSPSSPPTAAASSSSSSVLEDPATTATTVPPEDPSSAAAVEACRERRLALRSRSPAPSLTELGQVVAEDEAAGCAERCGPLLASLAAEDPCPDATGPGAP